ncbi:MAG: aminotransferase class I/II-fold pyridoxal phosphate-dependent enzyme [Lentisphaerae bacterium]|nr:MAG: aminotransferase class I/II-fold pyridoxal phosphate-dependent enzyme [Lentisphaerota bacterium]
MSVSTSHRNRVASHIASLPKSGIRDFFELVNQMDDVISLGVGEPDFVTPWGIREATIYGLEQGHTSYTSNLGLEVLRREICHYLANEYDCQYDPKTECIVTVGVSEAIDLAVRAIIEPGDEVIYHEPSYVSYNPVIRMAHGTPVAVMTKKRDDFALLAEDLEAAITPKTRAVIINFPNNPTGANLTFAQKQAIAEVIIRHDLILITDEIYSELVYDEEPTPAIASLPGMKERTLFLHGFSKAYAMTGYRIGYACGPHDLIDAMMKIHQYTMLCAPIMAQEAAIEALRHGKRERERMRREYQQRRNIIVNRMRQLGFDVMLPKGAFYIFADISGRVNMPSVQFARELLMQEKVAVVPGTAFCHNDGNAFIRCAYATPISVIETACERIRRFIDSLS